MTYVRFQSPTANARGTFPGVFALANGLARDGQLSEPDAAWLRSANDRGTAAYPDPAITHPQVYNRAEHPRAAAWFRSSATHLLDYVDGYLELLERYGVRCIEVRSDDPGVVLYADDVQVVVEPHPQS